MNLRLYLRDRKVPVAIVALTVAALVATLVSWYIQPQAKVSDFVGPPRSGYVLHNFILDSWNEQGAFSFRLHAPRLDRREGDDALYLISPDFRMPPKEADTPDWTGHSQYGWVDSGGDILKLQGDVHMHRNAFGTTAATQMDTAEVTTWPKENRLATDAPATIVQGTSTMKGVGMRANLDSKHLELLDDVHSSFMPKKRTP